jgi:aromatic ring-opening dioxygenase catalytic subunit (LigB family)
MPLALSPSALLTLDLASTLTNRPTHKSCCWTDSHDQPYHLLSNWEKAPSARDCHPARAEEHLIPLMTVAGAAGNDADRKVFSDRVMETTLSAFTFG